MQRAGFILNRIYFNYGTTKGTTPTAAVRLVTESQPKLGWGEGTCGNHRICLLKSDHSIRRLSCNLLAMTLFPAAKDDFTMRVTYTWKTIVATKSFLMADGGVVVGPLEAGEEILYDSTRLELFVYYVDDDGNGAWVASSAKVPA